MFVKRAPLSYFITRQEYAVIYFQKINLQPIKRVHNIWRFVLVYLLFTLNKFHTFFSVLIVPFEVNVAWYAPGSILRFRLNSQPLL